MPMNWVTLPLASKSYQPRSGTASIERLINMHAERNSDGAKTGFSLLSDPGLLSWTTVGSGPIRGMHRAFGYVWTVSGTELYAVNESTKAATLIGTIAGAGAVRMAHNATHVSVVSSANTYAANITTLTVLPNAGLVGVTFQDGYGVFPEGGTQNMFISGLDDLTSIAALDFTTVDTQPDALVTCVSNQREIWAMKELTTEVFSNTGATFPFARVAFIDRGVLAPGSVAIAETAIFWLGDDKRVYRSSGYQPVPVSDSAIELLIADTYSPTTAEAFTYTQAGHTFYVLTFSDLTLVYDLTTGLWHERRSYGLDRWRAQCHVVVGGDTNLVGDYSTGDIYELDLATYDENGEIMERIIVEPPLSNDPNPIFVHEMFWDMETGVGLTSGQGVAPVALLSWSDDDGNTWSSDRELSIGALGVRRQRVNFTRLGRSLNRSFRLRITDPVKVAIHGARARIESGVR